MIMQRLNKINSLQGIIRLVNSHTKSQLRYELGGLSGGNLGNPRKGSSTPTFNLSNVPIIRSIYAAGLSVINSTWKKFSDTILDYCKMVVANVRKTGFRTYRKEDVLLALACLKLAS